MGGYRLAYFDNAATTWPKPEYVYELMDRFYRQHGTNVGRGNYEQSRSAGSLVSDTRIKMQGLLHCSAKQVVFTPTATIALNMVIQGLCASGKHQFYISPFEHNAVTRTLHHQEKTGAAHVEQIYVSQTLEFDLQRIRYQFDLLRPDVVVISHASNTIGLLAPVEELCRLSKKYGAVTVLDMSQTAGLVDCNVGSEDIDFAIFDGHKTLYGPTGIAGFVMKPDLPLPAVIFGGTGYDSANQDMPDSLPERFEVGTMNISGVAGLNAALEWIEEVGRTNIYAAEAAHRERLLKMFSEYSYIHVVGNEPSREYVGIVSCLFDSVGSDSAGALLSRLGISVRTGLHCAPSAHKFLGTYPAGTIRFSVSYFTSDEEFRQLKKALDIIEDEL